MVNYYALLGVSQDASAEEIRLRLKERRRIWTQRQNAPRLEQQQEASNNLLLVPEMKATLLDATARDEYDHELRTTDPKGTTIDSNDLKGEDLLNEGWRLVSVGNIPDALMVATTLTSRQADNAYAWALLAYARARWGDTDDAVAHYKHALQLQPNEASFYYDLGSLYEDAEEWSKAMEQYQRAIQIDSQTTAYRAAVGSVLIKNERYQEGIELLEQCITEEPSNDGYRALLGFAYTGSAYRNWTYVERIGSYLTTKLEDLQQAERYLAKAKSLDLGDPNLDSSIEDIEKVLAAARRKRFHGNPLAVAGAAILGVVLLPDSPGVGLYFLIFGALYSLSCMTLQYKLNKRIIEGGGETSMSFIWDAFDKEGVFAGFVSLVFMFVVIMAAFPLVTAWNLFKNRETVLEILAELRREK